MAVLRSVQRLRRRWGPRQARNFRRGPLRESASGLLGQLYVDRGGGPEDTVYLAGHERSGTTWIAETVNHGNHYRYISEPFSRGRLEITAAFAPRQYLRAEERDPRYLGPAEAIVTGKVRSLFTDKYNRKKLPTKRMIKDVRGNLLLPWLHHQFPEMKLVFILRHPCAVVSSKMGVSESWKANIDWFLQQEDLVEDHLAPFRDVINGAQDEFERHIVVWCIDNVVPLRAFKPGDVHLAFYEELSLAPEQAIPSLYEFLGRPFNGEVLHAVSRPSATTRRDSAIVSGESIVDGWRRSITEDQLTRAIRILEGFGLDRIYGRGSMPVSKEPLGA